MNSMKLPVDQVDSDHQENEMNGLNHYVGTKIVLAKPMTRQEYNDYRGWKLPENENGNDAGYLVEYPEGISNHAEHRGYISWSPASQFDMAYIDLGNLQKHPSHEQRVFGELAQLGQRLSALQKFSKDDRFLKLPYKIRDLMLEQCRVMTRYLFILEDRVKSFA